MAKTVIYRLTSIILGLLAVVLLVWLWKNGYRGLSLLPLLLVALASFFLKKYKDLK